MKKILLYLSLLICSAASAQLPPVSGFVNRNTKEQVISTMAQQQLSPPADTTYTKLGFAIRAGVPYYGNGTYWQAMSSSVFTNSDGIAAAGMCPVTWVSDSTYHVGVPCSYYIGGVAYTSLGGNVKTKSDPTYDRQFAIVVNTSSLPDTVGGSAQPDPEVPTVGSNQLFLTSVYVNAADATATPENLIVRDEGAGGEWTISKTLTSTDNYGTNPFRGSISQRITGANSNQYMQWIAPAVQSKSSYYALILYIRNNSTFANVRNLTATLRNGNATQIGNALNLTTYGYSKTLLNTYQRIVIPMSAFAGADAFDRIRITNTQVGGTVDVQIDYVQLQGGISSTTTTPTKQVFFPTVAALRAYSGTTDIQATTQGYYAINDGGGASYYWDGTSTTADDGGLTIKLTSVGTGRFKLKYDNVVHLKWFGAKADSTTDARAALKAAISAITFIPLDPTGVAKGYGTVIIDRGKYYISDSIQIRKTINIIGEGAGNYPYVETQLQFSGIHGGLYFLMRDNGSGARNSIIKNIGLYSNLTDYHQTWHGLFSNATITIDGVSVYNFSGDGIIIDTRDSGNANNSYVRAHTDYNRRYGLSTWGNEANNMEIYIDANANGGSNVHEQGFLGNKYKWVHSSYAGVRQPNNLSNVTHSGTQYVCMKPNTAIEPGVTSGWQDYWYVQTNVPGGWTTTWSADSTYIDASAIFVNGAANASVFDSPYTEGGQGPVTFVGAAYATIMNANQNGAGVFTDSYYGSVPAYISNEANIFRINPGFIVHDKDYPSISTIITNANGIHFSGSGIGDLEIRGFTDSLAGFYANSNVMRMFSFPMKNLLHNTAFGRDTVIEATPIFGPRGHYISDISYTNTYDQTAPKRLHGGGYGPPTGTAYQYAAGDFVQNIGAGVDTIGWKCTVSGRPGTWEAVVASGSYPYVFTSPTEGQIVAFDASLNLVNIDLGDIGDVTTAQLADTAAAIRADLAGGGGGTDSPDRIDGTATGAVAANMDTYSFGMTNSNGNYHLLSDGSFNASTPVGSFNFDAGEISISFISTGPDIDISNNTGHTFKTTNVGDTTDYVAGSYVNKAYVDDHIANAGGGSSGITIDATAITGGTTNYVLFQKSDGTVTENYNFHFNPGTGTLTTYQFSANGGNFIANGAGVQIAGGQYFQMTGGSTFNGYQQSFDFVRKYPATGTAASITIDNTTENAVPSVYHLADFKKSGTLNSFIDKTGALGLLNNEQPGSSLTNGVYLYAEDVSSSAELKVRDEAGNITTLSPHNFTGIPQGKSNPLAWAFYSEKDGKYINVDMYKLAELVEKLTGEKLIYTGDVNNKPNETNK